MKYILLCFCLSITVSQISAQCAGITSGNARIPETCTEYYVCSGGSIQNIALCPDGQAFNSARGACDTPENALCTIPNPDQDCALNQNGNTRIPTTCVAYNKCIGGKVATSVDCADDQAFNAATMACDTPANAQCTIANPDAECTANQNANAKNPDDCGNYYVCIGGRITSTIMCLPGQTYNSATMACDQPEISQCTIRNPDIDCDEDQNGNNNNPYDCTTYVVCIGGRLSALAPCAPGLTFNDNIGTCDQPQISKCTIPNPDALCAMDQNGNNRNPNDCSSYIVCIGGKVSSRPSCQTGMTFNVVTMACDMPENSQCTIANPDPACNPTQNGNNPIPDDCTHYTVCGGGKILTQATCEPGKTFDSTTMTCDLPQVSQCTISNPDPVCVPNQNGNTRAADCTMYYVCVGGKVFTYASCATGKTYNVATGTCDAPEIAQCTVANPDPQCTLDQNGNNPNPADCTTYFYCVGGTLTANQSCPAGQTYDSDSQMCADPLVSLCKITNPDPICAQNQNTNLSFPMDCTRYYSCIGGKRSKAVCPTGLLFNSNTKVCDAIGSPGCATDPQCAANPTGNNPNPADCTRYYVCAKGKQTAVQSCPPGQTYNVAIQACDKPMNSKCNITNPDTVCAQNQNGNVSVPMDCTMYYACIGGEATKTACSTGLLFNSKTQMCDAIGSPGCTTVVPDPICAKTLNGYAPNPDACDSFYQCMKGKANGPIPCPNGLYFNPAKGNCDNPANVNCEPDCSSPILFNT